MTLWEQKERAGLLACEAPEWREKRLQAEDPNTTGDVLQRFADAIIVAWTNDVTGLKLQGHLLVEAIASHANTPPATLHRLLNLFTYFSDLDKPNVYGFGRSQEWVVDSGDLTGWATAYCARGICRNPVAPILCLEMPGFWEQVDYFACASLVREQFLPASVTTKIALHSMEKVAQNARLHVSFAGPIQTELEGLEILSIHQPIASTTVMLFGESEFDLEGQSPFWGQRAAAALKLATSRRRFYGDLWKRSAYDLLQHLSCDGNRLVRWIAQTRLANPDFVFTGQEGKG